MNDSSVVQAWIWTTWVLLLISAAGLGAFVGGLVGERRGRLVGGAITGLLLGPVGWALILLGPDKRRRCGHCLEPIVDQAHVCPHCHRDPIVRPLASRPVVLSAGPSATKPWHQRQDGSADQVEQWARDHPDQANPSA